MHDETKCDWCDRPCTTRFRDRGACDEHERLLQQIATKQTNSIGHELYLRKKLGKMTEGQVVRI